MKTFARWLFMRTHVVELAAVANYVKAKADAPGEHRYALGGIEVLDRLHLFVKG